MSLLRHLLDRLSTYLPLIVMALLASASWWLVRSVPTLMAPATQKPVRLDHSPDCIRAQSPKTRVAARRCLFQLLWALTFPPFKSTSAVQIHGELCGMYDVQFHHPQVWIRFTPSPPKLCDFLFIVNDLG